MECEVTNDAFKLRIVLQEAERLEGYIPTIGTDFTSKLVTLEGTAVTVHVWDTAGQERFRSIITGYFRGSRAFILTLNLCERLSAQTEEVYTLAFYPTPSLVAVLCYHFLRRCVCVRPWYVPWATLLRSRGFGLLFRLWPASQGVGGKLERTMFGCPGGDFCGS